MAGAIFVVMAALEGMLKAGVLDGLEGGPRPWIPQKHKDLDRQINAGHVKTAKKHRFGFNDRDRTPEKPPGITSRIAVLGDSFIWGSGVPYETIWSHKLEKRITEQFPHVEVLSWGLPGWSTRDQWTFFKDEGHRFDIDLLIVGFVINDPDMGDCPIKELDWKKYLGPLWRIFPDACDFISNRVNGFLYRHVMMDYGWERWTQNLYSGKNLKNYSALLAKLADFCQKKDMRLVFVMTPNNYNPIHKFRFKAMEPVFAENKIDHLDTYPLVYEKLHDVAYRDLYANPANPHPGERVTQVISDAVFKYLVSDRKTAPMLLGRVLDNTNKIPSNRQQGGSHDPAASKPVQPRTR